MLVTSLQKKLEKIDQAELSAETRKALLEDATRAVEQSIYPAYRELIAYFETLQPKATSNDGVWRLPDGDAYYAYRVKSNTTTDMSAEQIHADRPGRGGAHRGRDGQHPAGGGLCGGLHRGARAAALQGARAALPGHRRGP